MISNQKYSPLIAEALEELAEQGLQTLCPSLEKLFNELMLIEREEALMASPYERADQQKGYSNIFKNKMLQTKTGYSIQKNIHLLLRKVNKKHIF